MVSSLRFIMVVMIYEDLLRHGASFSVVSVVFVETLEMSSAAARWKAQEKRQVGLEKQY